jgi:hypothetical protein
MTARGRFAVALMILALVGQARADQAGAAASDDGHAPRKRGEVFVGTVIPRAGIGLGYVRSDSRGRLKYDAHDPFGHAGEAAMPWIAAACRVYGDYWLGAEYLAVEGASVGRIRVRQGIGPISYLVPSPMETAYRHEIGQVWLGRDLLPEGDLTLRPRVGLYLTRLRLKAVAPAVDGEWSDAGFGAMPLIGMAFGYGHPDRGRWSLGVDYGRIDVNAIHAHGRALSLAYERTLAGDWLWRLGHTARKLRIDTDRAAYAADVDLRLGGIYLQAGLEF